MADSDPSPTDRFVKEIDVSIDYHRRWSHHDRNISQALHLATAVSAFVALVAAYGLPDSNQVLRVALVALPAVFVAVEKAFKFEERSAWHTRAVEAYGNIRGGVLYQGKALADAEASRQKLAADLPRRWPRISADALKDVVIPKGRKAGG